MRFCIFGLNWSYSQTLLLRHLDDIGQKRPSKTRFFNYTIALRCLSQSISVSLAITKLTRSGERFLLLLHAPELC